MKSVRGFRKCGRLLGAFMKFLRNPGCGKRIRGEDFDKNKPPEMFRGLKGREKGRKPYLISIFVGAGTTSTCLGSSTERIPLS